MKIKYGKGKTEYGPGVEINMTGKELFYAIQSWLVGQNVHIFGSQTVQVNGDFCKDVCIYVDPSGFVIKNGKKISGRGKEDKK